MSEEEQTAAVGDPDTVIEYRRGHYEVSKQHDDRLLWAIAGVSAAIVAFFKWLPGGYPVRSTQEMGLALGFLALSLVVVLANMQLSMLGDERNIEAECGYRPKGRWPRFWRKYIDGGTLCPVIRTLNFVALLLFVVALAYTARFASANLDGRSFGANAANESSANDGSSGTTQSAAAAVTQSTAASAADTAAASDPATGSGLAGSSDDSTDTASGQ